MLMSNPIYDFTVWSEFIDPAGEMPEAEWTEMSDLQRLALALACFPDEEFEICSLHFGRCRVRIFPEGEFVRWEIVEFIHNAVYSDGGNYLTTKQAIEGLVKAL
jgi:hypothetical protein